MIAGVEDTHAAIWYLFADPHLSLLAKAAFDDAANAGRKVVLSVISLAEIVYLIEKGRLLASVDDALQKALHDPAHVLQEAPLTGDIIQAMKQVPRGDIPDMPDRIVAATAVYFDVPVISRDARIRSSTIQTIW